MSSANLMVVPLWAVRLFSLVILRSLFVFSVLEFHCQAGMNFFLFLSYPRLYFLNLMKSMSTNSRSFMVISCDDCSSPFLLLSLSGPSDGCLLDLSVYSPYHLAFS